MVVAFGDTLMLLPRTAPGHGDTITYDESKSQVIFYGGAVVITALTIWVLLTTAPISFG